MTPYSQVHGSGKPLIVMHGLFGMGDNWQTHAKNWADEGFEVHLLDLRNHGRSKNTPEHSYKLMADDLHEYYESKNIEKAIVLGHSMGGKVAMVFAANHPERVEKLIVVDIAPKGYPVHHQEIIDALRKLDFSKIKSRGEADETLKKHLPNFAVRQFLLKSLYWKDNDSLGLRFNLDAIENNIEMVGEPLPDDYRFEGPAWFVRGKLSGYIKDDDLALIHRHFPQSKLIDIAGAGHWVHAENPKSFYREITDILKA